MRIRERIEELVSHRAILLVGYLLFLGFCFPGFMSYDSGVQLEQARGLTPMSNWHPPVMAILWKVCDTVIAGPFLMLVIQSVSLLAGMYLVFRQQLSQRGAALAAVLILLSPPVIPTMGVIWKDSQMAGFLMLGIAMLLRQTRAALVFGCVLIWLGTAQRHNATAATLPILLLLFVWKEGLPRWKRYGSSVAVWLVITVSAGMANSCIADQKEDVVASLTMNDIVGIIKFTPGYTDEQIRADAPDLPWIVPDNLRKHARAIYKPHMTWLDTTAGTGVFRYPRTSEESAAVAKGWRSLILKHPLSYLRHRLKVFLCELRVIQREVFYIWPFFSDDPGRAEKLSLQAKHSWLQKAWMDMLAKFENTPVFWAWVYFLAGIALIWPLRRDNVGLSVVLSGVLCEAFLFIVAPAVDYRYSHWMITCTIVAAVYYIAARLRARRDMEKAA